MIISDIGCLMELSQDIGYSDQSKMEIFIRYVCWLNIMKLDMDVKNMKKALEWAKAANSSYK